MNGLEPRYLVEVKTSEKALKVESSAIEVIKGIVKGKMLTRMKREYVDCPVAGTQVAFLTCFVCVSHIRRVKGIVHCAGLEKRVRT